MDEDIFNILKEKKNNELKDFELLKSVVKNEKSINDIDDDAKLRIITLCGKRLFEIDNRIQDTKDEINKVEAFIKDLKKLNS